MAEDVQWMLDEPKSSPRRKHEKAPGLTGDPTGSGELVGLALLSQVAYSFEGFEPVGLVTNRSQANSQGWSWHFGRSGTYRNLRRQNRVQPL